MTSGSRPPPSRASAGPSGAGQPGELPPAGIVAGLPDPATAVGSSRALGGREPSLEVGEDVLDRLDADGQPHEVGGDARS